LNGQGGAVHRAPALACSEAMPSPHTPLRARGAAAVVLTRPDPPPRVSAAPASDETASGWPRWFAGLTAVALSAAVAWVWGLLLFGDSLSR